MRSGVSSILVFVAGPGGATSNYVHSAWQSITMKVLYEMLICCVCSIFPLPSSGVEHLICI